ncbi:hypothetical protein KPL74_20805 [Bacillus sp. NP157]|nr:hypothetical protein KPL74_20805 [Bacillus sp. NP157]
MLTYKPDPALAGPLFGKDPWPLRFHTHTFSAWCFNTLACSIVYNHAEFGTRHRDYEGNIRDKPSGPIPADDWRQRWEGGHGIVPYDGNTFPTDVELKWTSLDGSDHATRLDLDEMFKERLIVHRVAREDVLETWLDVKSIKPVSPSIYVEVDDRTINVYMRAMIFLKNTDSTGQPRSRMQDELILAWTHTY